MEKDEHESRMAKRLVPYCTLGICAQHIGGLIRESVLLTITNLEDRELILSAKSTHYRAQFVDF